MSNGIPTLDPDKHSLGKLRQHIFETYAHIVSEQPHTAAQMPRYVALLAKVDAAIVKETSLADAMVLADAAAFAADARLNTTMDDVAFAIHGSTRVNTSLPKHQDYFGGPMTLAAAKKPVLGTQLELMEEWPEKLAKDTVPAMQSLHDAVVAVVEEGVAKRKGMKDSGAANGTYRLYERRELFTEYNATAAATLGELTEYAHAHPELNLPSDWATSCFLHVARDPGPQTVAEVDTLLVKARAVVTELEAKRQELAQKAADSAQAQDHAATAEQQAEDARKAEEDAKKERKAAEKRAKEAAKKAKKKNK